MFHLGGESTVAYDKLNELMDVIIKRGNHDLKNYQKEVVDSKPSLKINHNDIDLEIDRINGSNTAELEEEKPALWKRVTSIGFDILFYGVIVTIVFVMIMSVQTENRYMDIFGYSPLYVETSSMESVMPRGSLIISKNVDPESLVLGDDITFFDAEGTQAMVTHRINKIIPNFERQGLAFETKGVDNVNVDEHKVFADNILGKVVFVLPTLGILFSYIKENLIQVVILVVLIRATVYMVSLYYVEFKEDRKHKQRLKKKEDELLANDTGGSYE